MKRSDDIQDELNKIAPTLAENPSTNPFATPHNYFDSLPHSILQRVKTEPKEIALSPGRWKNWLSVAAVFVALTIVGSTLLRNSSVPTNSTNPNESSVALKQMSDDELYDFLQEDISVLHVDDVAAGLPDMKLDSLENELVAIRILDYNDALMDLSNIDIESIDIESL